MKRIERGVRRRVCEDPTHAVAARLVATTLAGNLKPETMRRAIPLLTQYLETAGPPVCLVLATRKAIKLYVDHL